MITREMLTTVINEMMSDNQLEKLFDRLECCKNTNGFILQYVNETVLIYNTYTDLYVSWYKLTHIGRCIQSNIWSEEALSTCIKELIEELEE